MKILQWSMTIPINKQDKFLKWFKDTGGPQLNIFGAKKHEIFKVEDKPIIGRQTVEENKFIENIYFDNDFAIPSYFKNVKENPDTWKLSRMYEEEFGAVNIELRVLNDCQ